MPSTVKSSGVTNIEASPIVVQHRKKGSLVVAVDQIAVATTSLDEVGDIILLCPLPSNAVLTSLRLYNDDLDSNGTPLLAADVGLYYSGIGSKQVADGRVSGAVIDADCIATAITDLRAANVVGSEIRFEVANITSVDKELWELGGLSADPGGLFYIGITLTAAAATAAAGDIVLVAHVLMP